MQTSHGKRSEVINNMRTITIPKNSTYLCQCGSDGISVSISFSPGMAYRVEMGGKSYYQKMCSRCGQIYILKAEEPILIIEQDDN